MTSCLETEWLHRPARLVMKLSVHLKKQCSSQEEALVSSGPPEREVSQRQTLTMHVKAVKTCEHLVTLLDPDRKRTFTRIRVNFPYSDSKQPASLKLTFQGDELVNVNTQLV